MRRVSLLILRGRPRRPKRPRERLVAEHVIAGLRREIDRIARERSGLISQLHITTTVWAALTDLQQLYRVQEAQAALNREEIRGIKAREVPIMNREKKEKALELLYGLLEEAHDIREEQRLLHLDIEALKARAVGDANE